MCNKTYRPGKYVIIETEGSDDVYYIDAICELLRRLEVEFRWENCHPYPALERLVAYCHDERKWNMVEAYLAELEEMWCG